MHKLIHRKIKERHFSLSLYQYSVESTMWSGLEGWNTQSVFSNISPFCCILFFVAIRAVLEIWLPQIRHKHSNDLLSRDIKCLQLPIDLCELAPFWKQKLVLLNNQMWQYSCSCLTRPWYFLPGEVHEKPGFHLQFCEISGFQLLLA